MNVSALILAAGKGSRIGKPKLMLESGGKSFLNIIADKIKSTGIEKIICVVSENCLQWALENVPGIEYAVNLNPEDGMISSVYYGMKKIGKCDGVMITPVDHPFVEEETYKILIGEFCKNEKIIIKPKYKDKSGHPVILPFNLINTVNEKHFATGLDEIIRKSRYKQVYVEINDSSVLKNVNTIKDLSK
jgi:molybdenum cofactor cytidylyltransferase